MANVATSMIATASPNEHPKVLFVDDDHDVLEVSRLVFDDFEVDGAPLEVLTAESGAQAIEMFRAHPDIAVAYIDVAMENDHAGLDVVNYVREVLGNQAVQLIIRTGNPGQTSAAEIVRHLAVNDYRNKTELTAQQLETSMVTSWRNYRRLRDCGAPGCCTPAS